MAHTTDYSKSSAQIVLDLINADNNTNFVIAALAFEKGQVLSGGRWEVIIRPMSGSGHYGDQTVNYKPTDVSEAFVNLIGDGVVKAAEGETTPSAILNSLLGLSLGEEEVLADGADATLVFSPTTTCIVRVSASEESLVWTGFIDLEISGYTEDSQNYWLVREADTSMGYGVLDRTLVNGSENDEILLSEDGKIIID